MSVKAYLKLTNFELNRFSKIYFTLIGITILSQIVGAYVEAKSYLDQAQKFIHEESLTISEYVSYYGHLSFYDVVHSLWFVGPIALCIMAMLFYVLLIWYRDWYGKNTFIYRLLMLPTSRINIFFAKATAIFLMTLGLVAIQIVLLPIENQIIKWVVPFEFRIDLSLIEMLESFKLFMAVFPLSFVDFVVHYALGFIFLLVVFTAILFERSFRIKGIVLGIIYVILVQVIFALPFIITAWLQKPFLYPIEYFFLQIFISLVISGVSIWLSHYLLTKKVTV